MIFYAKSESCESITPTNSTDCFRFNVPGKYPDLCCYLNSSNPTESKCKMIPYSAYYSGYTKEFIKDKIYSVECDPTLTNNIKTYALEQCGNINEKKEASKNNCKKYSSFVDSCCYYSGKNDENDPVIQSSLSLDEGCYWLGAKYEGEIFWAGARLQCSNKYLKYTFSLFYFLLISLL